MGIHHLLSAISTHTNSEGDVYACVSVADAPFLPLLQNDLGQRDLIPVGLGASVIPSQVHMADYPDYAAFRPLDLEPSPYRWRR
jgi:hypothetical protein